MANKPQMKKEVALDQALESLRVIFFYATPDAKRDFEQFGGIEKGPQPDMYSLKVDARYDFGEVVNYIVNYGKA